VATPKLLLALQTLRSKPCTGLVAAIDEIKANLI